MGSDNGEMLNMTDLSNLTNQSIETIDDAGNHIIIHPSTPGNVLYAGMGRPCPGCRRVWFSCSHDLEGHRKLVCAGPNLDWFRSRYDNIYLLCHSEKDPQLAQAVRQQGKVRFGCYEITLSGDGKYLKKRKLDSL